MSIPVVYNQSPPVAYPQPKKMSGGKKAAIAFVVVLTLAGLGVGIYFAVKEFNKDKDKSTPTPIGSSVSVTPGTTTAAPTATTTAAPTATTTAAPTPAPTLHPDENKYSVEFRGCKDKNANELMQYSENAYFCRFEAPPDGKDYTFYQGSYWPATNFCKKPYVVDWSQSWPPICKNDTNRTQITPAPDKIWSLSSTTNLPVRELKIRIKNESWYGIKKVSLCVNDNIVENICNMSFGSAWNGNKFVVDFNKASGNNFKLYLRGETNQDFFSTSNSYHMYVDLNQFIYNENYNYMTFLIQKDGNKKLVVS